jgi:hypothetical protein
VRPIPEHPHLPPPSAEPPQPYRLLDRHLHLPSALPQAVSIALADASDAQQEAGALLYGIRRAEPSNADAVIAADTVCALVIPAQNRHRTHYRMPYEAIAAASRTTLAQGWVTLAQVHTHPGERVEHSWYDDRHAISTRALSFVLPHYGRHASDWLERIGVHDYQDDWWHQLSRDQIAARVSFIDAPLRIFDLRRKTVRTT